jgi:uncharacterized membrane protein
MNSKKKIANNKYFSQSTDRIKALTDGVFAIAMTLLVLSLELPPAHSLEGDLLVVKMLLSQLDVFYNYFLSFILLAFFWINHHNQFHCYAKTDNAHLWLNLFLLMFVALMPFSTVLVSDYPQYGAADAFFALNIILISLFYYLNYWYAEKKGYLVDELPKNAGIRIKKQVILVIGICFLAIFLAALYPPASSFVFLLIPLLMITSYFRR